MERQVTPKNERKRKALLIFPLLVIPFLTMAFWALGGGTNRKLQEKKTKEGLNLELPDAQLKSDKNQNKLSFYEVAEKDSAKLNDLIKNDPFYKSPSLQDTTPNPGEMKSQAFSFDASRLKTGDYKDPNEEKVYKKLSELNREISSAASEPARPKQTNTSFYGNKNPISPGDIDRLENMMQNIKAKGEQDPELDQLTAMMDKILDIQHPERVKQRMTGQPPKEKTEVFQVHSPQATASLSLLDTSENSGKPVNNGGFFSLNTGNASKGQNPVEAVVHGGQQLVNGAIIKLMLTSDLTTGSALIPKGNFVFGIATLNNERLEVQISSIRYKSSLFPVKLEVYDLDGLPGIYIPGAITRDVAKETASNGSQMLEITSLDPSLKAQAASAGVGAVKTWLNKKAKLTRVFVKPGYKVLLLNKSLAQ
jgi:conjugative transposon TraM protein